MTLTRTAVAESLLTVVDPAYAAVIVCTPRRSFSTRGRIPVLPFPRTRRCAHLALWIHWLGQR